jgi:hypothetical protein
MSKFSEGLNAKNAEPADKKPVSIIFEVGDGLASAEAKFADGFDLSNASFEEAIIFLDVFIAVLKSWKHHPKQ